LLLFGLLMLCVSIYANNPFQSPKSVTSVNVAVAEFEPALAVRASACITCHGKIRSSYITDFGYGDRSALEDSSCHDDTISFSHLLLNAPLVHSRYKGNFKGLVIAEVILFRLGKASFEFDPVFKNVPTLPVLKDSDYLQVK
jgi:hypothetical protein